MGQTSGSSGKAKTKRSQLLSSNKDDKFGIVDQPSLTAYYNKNLTFSEVYNRIESLHNVSFIITI